MYSPLSSSVCHPERNPKCQLEGPRVGEPEDPGAGRPWSRKPPDLEDPEPGRPCWLERLGVGSGQPDLLLLFSCRAVDFCNPGVYSPDNTDALLVTQHVKRLKVWEHFEKDLVVVGDVPKAVCKYCGMKLICTRRSGTSTGDFVHLLSKLYSFVMKFRTAVASTPRLKLSAVN